MDELEAGVELSLTVFPEATAFLNPGEGTLHDPTFGHDGKAVEVTAFGDLHRRSSEGVGDGLGKRFTGISSIDEHVAHGAQIGAATGEGFQSTFAIGHLGGGHCNRVGQALGIDGNVTFDARYFLAGIIALLPGAIGVLHALGVHDQERRGAVAPLFHADLANLIF